MSRATARPTCYLCGRGFDEKFPAKMNGDLKTWFKKQDLTDEQEVMVAKALKKQITPATVKDLPKEMQELMQGLNMDSYNKISPKCRYHDHITGKYRGAAHSCCNVKIRSDIQANSIPVVFHNAKGYDSHFIVQALAERINDKMRLGCIAEGSEKFKALNIGALKIIDSCAHMQSSLDKLLGNLPNDQKTRLRSLCATDEQCSLINRKLILSYEKMTSHEWFSQKNSYNADDYDSSLSNSKPKEADMDHLRTVVEAASPAPEEPLESNRLR
jgi:hypothetical protein